jgi:hypothetical protein
MSLTEDLRIAGLSCLLRHAQDVMLSKRRQQEEQLSVRIADFGDLLGLMVSPDISTKLNMVLTFFPDLMASARHREPKSLTASTATPMAAYQFGGARAWYCRWMLPLVREPSAPLNQFPHRLDWSLLLVNRCKTGSSVEQMMIMCALCAFDLRQSAENIVIAGKRAEN